MQKVLVIVAALMVMCTGASAQALDPVEFTQKVNGWILQTEKRIFHVKEVKKVACTLEKRPSVKEGCEKTFDHILARFLLQKSQLELRLIALKLDRKEQVLMIHNLLEFKAHDAMSAETERMLDIAGVIFPPIIQGTKS